MQQLQTIALELPKRRSLSHRKAANAIVVHVEADPIVGQYPRTSEHPRHRRQSSISAPHIAEKGPCGSFQDDFQGPDDFLATQTPTTCPMQPRTPFAPRVGTPQILRPYLLDHVRPRARHHSTRRNNRPFESLYTEAHATMMVSCVTCIGLSARPPQEGPHNPVDLHPACWFNNLQAIAGHRMIYDPVTTLALNDLANRRS